MSDADVLKTGDVLKLTRGLLSKRRWKAKSLTVCADGSVTYRDRGSGRGGTTGALLAGGLPSPAPGLLVRALQALPAPDACASVFCLHVQLEPDEPPRQLVFAAPSPAEEAAWRAAAAKAAPPPRAAPPCGPDVVAAARALNLRARTPAVAAAEAAGGPGAPPAAVLRELRVPQAIRALHAAHAGGERALPAAALAALLRVSEGEAERRAAAADGGGEGADAAVLRELLCAPANAAIAPEAAAEGDMRRPLSEYFVCSSHNTYLVGDQVMSASAAAMYRATLALGVRCVELDLWDDDDGPVITHGNTATSKLPLREALVAIARYAFEASSFPLILSLENHLSLPNQVVAAGMMLECFGEYLHVIRLAEGEPLPSPEELKGKVLVKAKMGEWAHASLDSEDSGDFDEDDVEYAGEGGADAEQGETRSRGLSSLIRRTGRKKEGDGEEKGKRKKKHLPIARELAAVTSFGGANRKQLLALWDAGGLHPAGQLASDIVSINESKVERVFETRRAGALRAYNAQNLTRVYPKASRVDSSNYNPLPAWAAGCQLVALNYQAPDLGLRLGHGRFAVAARAGYALRPPQAPGPLRGRGALAVAVLCGSLLPRAPTSRRGARDFADPYVEVTVVGAGDDGEAVVVERKTESVDCNGLCPSWGERFEFDVACAETDMLVACVWDDDTASKDDLIGFYAAPVNALREGIRAMHLAAPDGAPLLVPGTSELPTVVVDIAWTPAPTEEGTEGGSAGGEPNK